jgi:hypothetical protein
MAKTRGRKKGVATDPYFGPKEEEAVLRYLKSEDNEERNAIYNEYLKAPLDKMIESIIRRYKLYRKTESFVDLHADTLSNLITKAHKFEDYKGKAYSYYGTICKNYLLNLIISDEKKKNRTYEYEALIPKLEESDEFKYEIDKYELNVEILVKNLIESIEKELDGGTTAGKKKPTENEIKVGYALIDILNNWTLLVDLISGGSKFNKISILETIRNYTNLSTKDIRGAMKRFKKLYSIVKFDTLDDDVE